MEFGELDIKIRPEQELGATISYYFLIHTIGSSYLMGSWKRKIFPSIKSIFSYYSIIS
jgi:hypothetical protein